MLSMPLEPSNPMCAELRVWIYLMTFMPSSYVTGPTSEPDALQMRTEIVSAFDTHTLRNNPSSSAAHLVVTIASSARTPRNRKLRPAQVPSGIAGNLTFCANRCIAGLGCAAIPAPSITIDTSSAFLNGFMWANLRG